jgi:hypothetical protein
MAKPSPAFRRGFFLLLHCGASMLPDDAELPSALFLKVPESLILLLFFPWPDS